jgi:hypothetical protein
MARALPDQPVRVTRDSAVAAGRVDRRRRWQTQPAIAIAAFCAAALAVVVPFGLGRPGPHGARGPAPAPTSSVQPSASSPASPSASAPPSPSAMASSSGLPTARPGDVAGMSAALLAEAHRLLRTARFDPVTVGGFPDGNPTRAPFGLADNGHGYDVAFAQILVPPSAVGTFVLAMWPGAGSWKAPTPGCDNAYQPMLACATRTGPAGERVWLETGNYQGTPTIEHKVKVFRTDGTILVATVNNAAADQTVYGTPGPASTEPPMTTDQMLTLLSIPGLTLAKS